MTIRAIIFDLGGVLLSPPTLRPLREAHARVLGVSYEKLAPAWRAGYEEWKRGRIDGRTFWQRLFEQLGVRGDIDALMEMMFEFSKPDKKMFELVRDLRARGYRIVVFSNTLREWYEFQRQKFGYAELFDAEMLSFELGCAKPEQQCYAKVLDKLGLKAEECVFVDDDPENVAVARRQGMCAVRFESVEQLRASLSSLGVELD